MLQILEYILNKKIGDILFNIDFVTRHVQSYFSLFIHIMCTIL